jgi:hypothetical protein
MRFLGDSTQSSYHSNNVRVQTRNDRGVQIGEAVGPNISA